MSDGPPRAEIALPEVVRLYHSAHDNGDVDSALAAFKPDARVSDDGHVYAGSHEIRHWLAEASKRFSYTRTQIRMTSVTDGVWVVVNRLEGDFPGGIVDLQYRFVLADNLIAELAIAP